MAPIRDFGRWVYLETTGRSAACPETAHWRVTMPSKALLAVLRQCRLSAGAAIFLFALLIRLCVLFRATGTPEFQPSQGDMKFYSDWARSIAAGHWTDHRAFYGLPLYAYWLAAIYRVAGFQPYFAALFQVVAEAGTTLLIFKLAPCVFVRPGNAGDAARAPWIGAIAAFGWIFFVPAEAYSAILMPTTYLVLAFWFVVWWVVKPRPESPRLRDFFLLGLLAGFVAMMVANILFLLPLVIAAIWWRRDWRWPAVGRGRLRVAAAALLLAGTLAGASPCTLHNYLLAGEPVFLSAHSGINFFIGNNAQSNGYPQVPAPLHTDQKGMLNDSILWAERAAGHPLQRAQVSAFWSGLASRYIHEHPIAWLRLLGRKFENFWNGFQYDDLGILTPLKEDGVLFPGIGFGLVAALGLPGLVLAVWRRPAARWIALAVGLHLASLMTVFVTERYRMAAVPGLLLLGAFGLMELWREIPAARWRPVAVYAAAFAGSVVLVCWPVDAALRSVDEFNSSLADLEQNRLGRAQEKLERVYAAHPNNAETAFALGNLWLAKGDRDRAKYFYRRTLQLDPQHDRALNNLGALAFEEKRWNLAELFLNGSLQIEPDDAKTCFLLAQVRWERHDYNGARVAIANAVRLQPDTPEFRKLSHELESDP
jgi:tetratricopeptide (TPR) repeat protein